MNVNRGYDIIKDCSQAQSDDCYAATTRQETMSNMRQQNNPRARSSRGSEHTERRAGERRPRARTSSGDNRNRAENSSSFKPYVSLIVLLAIIAVIVCVGYAFSGQTVSDGGTDTFTSSSTEADATSLEATDGAYSGDETHTVKVTFAGDCTLGTDEAFNYSTSFNAAYTAKDNPSWFLANVEPLFADDDLTIVNMEGTLTKASARQDKTFAFKGDAEYAKVLSSSSVEAASLANNHSFDYGQQSFDDTKAALVAENIKPFGYSDIAYMDVNGVKVALIGTNALADTNGTDQDMIDHIHEARDSGAQLVLVYIHWGVEREYVPRENERSIGHAAIDAGADLVVGSHPHVIQGYEKYEGRYIVYSLGNFCFGGNSNPTDKDCMIFQQTFTVSEGEAVRDDAVEFIACSISSVQSTNNYQPTIATGSEKTRIDAKIQDSTDKISAMGE